MGGGKRLVLLGAGHAHLHVISHAARLIRRGHSITVVAPGRFWYSGRATGMLGGAYGPEQVQVDVAALAADRGCALEPGVVTALDPAAKRVRLQDRPDLPYDVVSVALGSEIPPLPGIGGPGQFGAKPISALWALRQHIERGPAPSGILVAGGGMTACELAANLAALLRGRAAITLVAPPGGLLAHVPAGAARAILRVLRQRGVIVRQDGPVLAVEGGQAVLPQGVAPFGVLVNATGLAPCSALRAFGLTLRDGALVVDGCLRSIADPAVHGAGDCITFEAGDLPRAGVFAVRQGPVLLHNLAAALDGSAPIAFVPQRRYLWIMNLGDGTGLASYGALHWRSRWALALKHRIDRRFLDQYRVLPSSAAA